MSTANALKRLRSACAVRGLTLTVTSSHQPRDPSNRPHAIGAAPSWVTVDYGAKRTWTAGDGDTVEAFLQEQLEHVRARWPASARGGANNTAATRAAKQARIQAEQRAAMGVSP